MKPKIDLTKLSKEEKLRMYDLLCEKERRLRERKEAYTPNPGQLPVHTSTAKLRCVFSGNGAGKCYQKGTKLLAADGNLVTVESLEEGDQLLGPDSKPRTIKALGTGLERMYEIKAADNSGKPYVVNESHILSLQYCSKDGRYGLKQGEVIEVELREYLKWSPRKKRLFYGWRPGLVQFPSQEVTIPPYVLGAWLGDGHSKGTALTSMYKETANEWLTYAQANGMNVRVDNRSTGLASSYFLSKNGKNQFLAKLQKYNLIGNKHIPTGYILNSEQVRLQVLAGLIDTDGHLTKSGNSYEIIQKKKELAEGIAFLARSLGFKVTWRPKVINQVTYYRLSILGHIWRIPVLIERKKATPKKQQRDYSRFKIEVTPLEIDRYYGFTLEEDPLHLGEDFTVLHNTAMAANEALWAVSGYNPITDELTPVPAKVIVLLDSPDKVEKLWLPELRKWANIEQDQLKKNGKPYYTQINFKNGSTIEFYFHQQEAMIFESIELDWLIADEPPPRHIYVALRRGARKKNSKPRFLLVGTPITGAWLRKEVYEPWTRGETEDTECFTFGTQVNEANLADNFIEDFSKVLTEKEKQIRLQGMFFDLDGLALAHLVDREQHIVRLDWKKEWPVVVAIDPHGAKPHHAVMIGADPDNRLYVLKETSAKLVARDFARMLKQWYRGHRVIDIVVDSLGSAEHTGGEGFKSFIQILNDEGVRARATTWSDKSDEEFIDRIRSVLTIPQEADNFGNRVPRLRFHPDCIGCISDVENVQWVKQKNLDEYKPKLDISNKDFLSCIKYALASNVTHDKQKTKIYKRNKPAKTYGIKRLGAKRWR